MSKTLKVVSAGLVLALVPLLTAAQGRIAVVNVEGAILQTDVAQEAMNTLRETPDYKADKAELDRLKTEGESLIRAFKNDLAAMSPEQQQVARKRLTSKNADLEHVARKLQQAEQELGQTLLAEMAPRVEAVLRDLIESESIGLLVRRNAVIHADNGFSLTAKVTDKLNQQAAEQ